VHKTCHVHLPWRNCDTYLPFILEHGLHPEIAFKGPDLDTLDLVTLENTARKLSEAGLAVTVHAPFADLNPGALEPLVYEATERRYMQAIKAAEALGAYVIVYHPGYDRWKYSGNDHLWHEQNLRFWPSLITYAETIGCRIALENIYEHRPDTLAKLLNEIDSPSFGHCFDVGHWNLFSESTMETWFDALGSRTIHLHLHDNHGRSDEHLPVCEGEIDFDELFTHVRTFPAPPSMTLEAHDPQAILRSLKGVSPYLSLP